MPPLRARTARQGVLSLEVADDLLVVRGMAEGTGDRTLAGDGLKPPSDIDEAHAAGQVLDSCSHQGIEVIVRVYVRRSAHELAARVDVHYHHLDPTADLLVLKLRVIGIEGHEWLDGEVDVVVQRGSTVLKVALEL